MRKKKGSRKKIVVQVILSIAAWLVLVSLWHALKPLPEGISYESPVYHVEEVSFLGDLTYKDAGERVSDQMIFDRVFQRIDGAEDHIIIDMFLFNSHLGGANSSYRQLSGEMVSHLIAKKKENPYIRIDFISDPINVVYGGAKSKELDSLREAGINVIITDLSPLRDGNLPYSPFYRVFLQWFGVGEKGILPHPFSPDEPGVSFRSYFRLLNFKANHRKMVEVDGNYTIVASANPHDGSSAHSNVAIEIVGPFSSEAQRAALAVAEMSGEGLESVVDRSSPKTDSQSSGRYEVQLLTEGTIRDSALSELKKAGAGDSVVLAVFYLSDRAIVQELIACKERGAEVTVILDPNKDAFGYKKPGIPNKQVAQELVDAGITFRWYDTHGEQFHTKMLMIDKADGTAFVLLGSANFTRKNLRDYNLEMDVSVTGDSSLPFFSDARGYIKRVMDNADGIYTTGYDTYKDEAFWKVIVYHLQERLGLSSF